jgi:hypothetical protein
VILAKTVAADLSRINELRKSWSPARRFVDKEVSGGQNEKASFTRAIAKRFCIVTGVPRLCPNGGIGRRARFRTWFSQGSGGSSPLSGTKFFKRFCQSEISQWTPLAI